MTKRSTHAEPTLAPVDDYPPRPDDDALRTLEQTLAAEARYAQDQNRTYHQDNPTLDTSGPEYDPVVQERLRREAAEAGQPTQTEIRRQAKEIREAEAGEQD